MENFFFSTTGYVVFTVLMLWSSVWKGIALWKAARNSSLTWYILLLIFNTAGILEIIYIYIISSKEKSK